MANDAPTSLRMGFGHRAAHAAGVSNFSIGNSRRWIEKQKTYRARVATLRREAQRDPEWGDFIHHWITQGLSEDETLTALHRAKEFMKRRNYVQRTFADERIRKALLDALLTDPLHPPF